MTTSIVTSDTQKVFRVDKFQVPSSARSEFIEKVAITHEVLQTQPGFLEDFVLEQTSGPGVFNFVTIAVWESDDAIKGARSAVLAKHSELGFNPQEMYARLGIEADLANYKEIDG